jgi:hypothetical protein
MRTWLRIAGMATACLALSGCLTFGRIEVRGTTINEGIGAMQNRAILLNLARASQGEPLYFLSITQVQAQGALDLKVSAPGFNEGRGQTAISKLFAFNSAGSTFMDNSTNTNMQVGVYNTQAFYSGMLQPLGLDEVDLLLHQGFPRELVFYLVIDKVKLTTVSTGKSQIIYNDPTSPTYGTFKLAVQSAMDHGLTTEVSQPDDKGALDAAPPAPDIAKVTTPPGGADKGPPPHAELCFESALATDAAMDEFADLTKEGKGPNFCGSKTHGPQSLTVRLFGQDTEVEVTTRSVYSMFTYLGNVMNVAGAGAPRPALVDYGNDYKTKDPNAQPPEQTPVGPLMNVTAGGGPYGTLGIDCFAAVGYAGRSYCVPQKDSQVTKDIFNVLSVLVALKQSPGDLPATQSVLIAP